MYKYSTSTEIKNLQSSLYLLPHPRINRLTHGLHLHVCPSIESTDPGTSCSVKISIAGVVCKSLKKKRKCNMCHQVSRRADPLVFPHI